ncbi:transketolase family protein [Candidatus Aerophobetes bacterium]|uniref:Transketolase family protein n=1 Tax=Aerophobetes bacterium TaxID=2030807 RepID=A0A523YRA5_UNCAE|nr:MAG: transketolase family protein [Candidatus Aerophobetes bacterium]
MKNTINSPQLMSTRDAYGQVLVEIGKEQKNIVVLNADLSQSTRTSLFAETFPERFFNAGIAEQNMMGVAAGLATTGFTPIVSTLAIFAAGRAYDQVRNTIVHSGLNVKIVATHSGITMGKDGSSHQSIEDIALMRVIPDMTVIVPADALETKKALRAAIEYKGPVYIRLGRPEIPVITDEKSPFVIGKADILRKGNDLSIIACGIMVFQALKAADALVSQGIKARVINMHTIKPLDLEILFNAAKETGAILTAEDHSIIGGLGSAVLEALACKEPRPPVYRIGVRDVFGESGEPDDLIKKYGLSWKDIVKAAKEVLSLKED